MKDIPLESNIQKDILKYLKSRNDCWFFKAHSGSSYSSKGTPDIIGHYRGLFVGFEVKRPKVGVLSDLQANTIRKINTTGGRAYIVTSVEEVKEILENVG
ncbi:nuclease [Sporanaerobium hydrogeniformans]|uniref:Nuclease n=1 Tax=Sporanaerobium hydrogeniformans TaxID=3072179 RepID=A0AC61DH80_9FIRM|nr:nuclease [Sporanaerobium hydrogeniformans]PHV72170.1 nuclease [Sporanaerobium hydrogeniformans]